MYKMYADQETYSMLNCLSRMSRAKSTQISLKVMHGVKGIRSESLSSAVNLSRKSELKLLVKTVKIMKATGDPDSRICIFSLSHLITHSLTKTLLTLLMIKMSRWVKMEEFDSLTTTKF